MKALLIFLIGGGAVASFINPVGTELPAPKLQHAESQVEAERVEFNELGDTQKAEFIYAILESEGVPYEDQLRFQEIIRIESQHNEKAVPPVYVSVCDRPVQVTLWGYLQAPSNIIEVHDEEGGIYQATCEEYGAVTLDTQQSKGLMQILDSTWTLAGCEGDPFNAEDNVRCGVKIYRLKGFNSWSANNLLPDTYE